MQFEIPYRAAVQRFLAVLGTWLARRVRVAPQPLQRSIPKSSRRVPEGPEALPEAWMNEFLFFKYFLNLKVVEVLEIFYLIIRKDRPNQLNLGMLI